MQVQVVSIVAYVGALLGIVLMYVWYAPTASCELNIIFITVTLVLVLLMTFISVNSKVISYKAHTVEIEWRLSSVVKEIAF
jgi:hypothetical protein